MNLLCYDVITICQAIMQEYIILYYIILWE